jgi:hypothetical protein
VTHKEAWARLPDLLEDRDDWALLAHVRACADCQRQLFLLGRVDRLLREREVVQARTGAARLPGGRMAAAVAAIAAASAVVAVLVIPHGHGHELRFRTDTGRAVGQATIGRSDGRNVSLALAARDLPVDHGNTFVLWAAYARTSMQVGRFMVDRSGACHVGFNLPATHPWQSFWITRPGSAAVIART